MRRNLRIAGAILGAYGAGIIGWLFVDPQVNTWYASLLKPPLTPPDTIFTVVLVILYALMAIACSIIWLHEKQDSYTEGWVRFFFIQLLFNAAWTVFFFGFHSIWLSFLDTLCLGFIVLALMLTAFEIDRRAGWLMVPYLLWMLFTAYLTLGIWILN